MLNEEIQPEEMENEKKASDPIQSKLIEEILRGNISVDCPSTTKIVRIFTSSTFTDTKHERNYLMEKIYPRLKEFCQSEGYEFQVVDMRWGVRNEATDDHLTTELCLKEIDLCNKLSTGPSFVTFLSHKYGYRDVPRKIEAMEFEKLFDAVKADRVKHLLSRWFTRDDNSVPSTYILQPISSRLPHYISVVEDEKKQAETLWNNEREEMRLGLVKAAKQILDSESSHKYLRSVTDAEIDGGLINNGERAYWFERRINGIETVEPTDILRKYRECSDTEEYVTESHQLLNKLSEEKLRSKLPADHIKTYGIHWTNKGIDPDSDKAHKLYIEKLGDDFETTIKKAVSDAIDQKKEDVINQPLYEEVLQHVLFCQEKCRAFYGREEIFHVIREYINDPQNNKPLIVHGESGSGKTSIMAMAVKNAWNTEVKPTIIIRFLGTTPDSSNIISLLLSVINQISTVYNEDLLQSDMTVEKLSEEFETTLELAMEDKPLLIVLDSLDQLNVTGGARQLSWLPSKLPKYVKMIVSTLPEPEYECFPNLQTMFTDPKQFIPVTFLSNHNVDGILNKWLENNHKKLQEHQLKTVKDAFQKCPIPLFLKLAFDEACRWKSFTPIDQSVLNTTVRSVINDLFNRIEKLHGKLLVSRALGYLTLSSGGLMEAELEDILSCDDDVLNDVYQWWTPPVRRLPPLLLVRIKTELEEYFVDRGSDGVRVFYWYHRQFIEAAKDRYCSEENTRKMMHGVLADFFSGVWANGKKKPYTNKKGKTFSADRLVAAQPTKFPNNLNQSESLNLRKLNHLPHHRLQADQKELLKSECLCNFDFILHKLKGSGLRLLLDDFCDAKEKYEDDTDISSICDALQLSQRSLQINPHELPSQLLGRLKSTQGLEKLLEASTNSPYHYLLPSKPIGLLVQQGGSLLYLLDIHKKFIRGLDLNKTGELAATCDFSGAIKVISVKSGKLINSFDVDLKCKNVQFCNNDETLILNNDESVLAVGRRTGLKQYTINGSHFAICGENKELIGVFEGTEVVLYDASTGDILRAVECEFLKRMKLSFHTQFEGSKRYMAAVDKDRNKVIVFDTETNQFLHQTKLFDGDYVIDVMLITPDCKHIIVSASRRPNLLIYDITNMKLVRKIPGASKLCDCQITPDSKTFYYPNVNKGVTVVEMETGETLHILQHPTWVKHVRTLDMNIFVTAGFDNIVRIWDLSRNEELQKSTSDKACIKSCTLNDHPRYVLTQVTDYRYSFIEVFDLFQDRVVKRDKFIGKLRYIYNLGGTRYLCTYPKGVILYNAKTGEIEKSFKVVIRYGDDIKIFPSKKEFCVLSRERTNLKIIDIETGKVEIIKGCDEQMRTIVMNDTGTRIACGIKYSSNVVLFDMVQKQVLYQLTASMIPGCKEDEKGDFIKSALTADGKYFIQLRYFTSNSISNNGSEGVRSVVWNIETKKVQQILSVFHHVEHHVEDYEYLNQKLLDNTTLVTSYVNIVKVFNIETGTVSELLGHIWKVDISTMINSPFFFTFSHQTELIVWDRETYECVASYYTDSEIKKCQFSPDGYRIIALPENGYPIYFEIYGGTDDKYKPKKHLDQYEELFHPTDEIREIRISVDYDDDDDDDDDKEEEEEEEEEEGGDDNDDEEQDGGDDDSPCCCSIV